MFRSLESCSDEFQYPYDVCIIGSGIAGHAVLYKIITSQSGKHLKIAMIEGSTQSQRRVHRLEQEVEHYPLEQDLYAGEISGWINDSQPQYLITSRQRAFGGTTNIWSGWCWPLEKEDMEERPLRKGFYWPVSYKEMVKYFQQAQEFCGLSTYQYDSAKYWVQELKTRRLASMSLDGSPYKTRMLYFNPSSIYEYYLRDLAASDQVDIFTNAHCLRLNRSPLGEAVDSIMLSSIVNGMPTEPQELRAKKYIVAAGCFETTRLLLNSDFDKVNFNVGKNFMEHPYLWVASKFQFNVVPEDIRNFYFPKHPVSLPSQVGIIPALIPTQSFIQENDIGTFRVLLGGAPHIPGTINISWEQMPNLENTISLSETYPRDIFGQKRLKLNNVLCETDKKTIICAINSSVSLLSKLGYGVEFKTPDLNSDPLTWGDDWKIVPGNHPMGTTSMSFSKENGVVDPNCKIHGIRNLFIASSSVFPTAGYANSTFTLIALSLRLGEHIVEK